MVRISPILKDDFSVCEEFLSEEHYRIIIQPTKFLPPSLDLKVPRGWVWQGLHSSHPRGMQRLITRHLSSYINTYPLRNSCLIRNMPAKKKHQVNYKHVN